MPATVTWPGKRLVSAYVHGVVRDGATRPPATAPDVLDDLRWVVCRGDNFDHLGRLATGSDPKFDLVYLDPPYNCGYELAAYDDTASDPLDSAWLARVIGPAADRLDQHERWLSLIYGRLLLIRRRLASGGTVVASIDSCEAHRLRLLLEEVFRGRGPISTVCWPHTVQPLGSNLPVRMNYLLIVTSDGGPLTLPRKVLGSTAQARAELTDAIGADVPFETPKPQSFLRYLVRRFTNQRSLVLDPYAGSGGLGAAVVTENLADGGARWCTLMERSDQALDVLERRGRALAATARARPT